MATGPNNIPLTAWTCPHCAAVWHSGRQYCIDCGYGMAPAVARVDAAGTGQTLVVPTGQTAALAAPQQEPPYTYEDILALGGQEPQTVPTVDGTGFAPPG